MKTFTLDTNCIIALEQSYDEAAGIRRLLDSHDEGSARVQVVGIAASERTKGGIPLGNFSQFISRLGAVGMQNVQVLRPPCYADVSFLDWSIIVDDDQLDLERRIHEVLFPKIAYDASLAVTESDPKSWGRWLNAKCDVLTAWCHIYYKGNVLITSDGNFLRSKRAALIALGMGDIRSPAELA